MAANLGALTVSLGLDAADYTRGLTKAEKQAYDFGESIGKGIRTAAEAAATALVALGASAGAAVAGFNSLIDGASKFADLADKTGASAEGLASFAVAAGTSGVEMDKIATAANMLTKNLVGVDDEAKAAGAALTALGIPVKDFKALAPEAQIEKLSKTFAEFKDGAGKTAAAMALFGRAGADVLPFLKTLDEQGGRQVILTQQQIDQADKYADRQAKSKAELQLYAQALATQAIPAITAFTGALTDTIKELLGVGKGATDLKNSTAIADFAENAVSALGFVLDAADGVARVFRVVGTSIGGAAAAASAAASGEFSQAKSIMGDIGSEVDKILLPQTFGQKLKARIDEQKRMATAALRETRGFTPGEKTVDYSGAAKTGKAGRDTAAQEAKAQLAADLSAIKSAQDAITNTYANSEKVLEALRAAGLRDESQYYGEKQRLAAATALAQEDALQKQIARMELEKLSGKDAIENQKKIAEAEAALAKVRENAATTATVLSIQQETAYKKIASAILSARQAAVDFFDTTNRGYERALEGIGQGTKARDLSAGITQIEDRYREQRQALQNQKAQAELMGSFGPDAQRQFDEQLGIINEFQAKAIKSFKDYYGTLDLASRDWSNGAAEALKNYADQAADVAKQMEQAVGSAFKGLEDQLVEFVTGGKADFKSLVDSILKDVARMAIKQSITGPLADLLGGSLKGSGTSGGGSSWLKDLIGGFSSIFGGGRAIGGGVEANTLYQVAENRPEMLDVNGKSFLMMGNQRGNIDPNPSMSGGGMSVVINQSFAAGTSRQTTDQAAQQAGRAIERAQRRNG